MKRCGRKDGGRRICIIRLANSRSLKTPIFSASLLFCSLFSPALADSYEFEMITHSAEAESRKIDILELQKKDLKTHELRESKLLWKEPEKSVLIVRSGPNALSITNKNICRIFDFKEKKIWTLDSLKKTYSKQSLYADISFRVAELKNRILLASLIRKGLQSKLNSTIMDPFFSEEMLALSLPGRGSGYKLEKQRVGATEIYKHASMQVSAFSPGSTALSGDRLRQFSRFLIYGTNLHPEIRADIEKSGKLPQKLMFYVDNQPLSAKKTELTLKKISPGDYCIQIPSTYCQAAELRNPLTPVYKRIEEMGGKPPAELRQLTVDYFKKAAEEKRYLDAMLSVLEFGLQTGEKLGDELSAIRAEISKDQDCRHLLAGLSIPESENEARTALASLDRIDRKKVDRSYLIDIFRANLLVYMADHGIIDSKNSPENDPVKTFISVLLKNPFITGVYHDLGKYLESSYMQNYAWDCYDLARKFYPEDPVLSEIADREKELESNFPQFIKGDEL